ncbi:PLP-dependent transferase [Pontiella sp.]|uniref:PLP-dependent transferase n=1 Tax=Pontiella sp. TaxID=2837462 RepID=UPI00356A2C1F
MPQETLRQNPLWRAEDLGKPIPNTPHAISMCLPRWQDVVGYEEKDPATMEKLHLGYPRFFYHPLVEAAAHKFRKSGDECVQLYTTRNAAERCAAYLWVNDPLARLEVRAVNGSSVYLISFPEKLADAAKAYWQHAGEGISSRCAEALLNGIPAPDASAATALIKTRISEFSGAKPEDIYLFPSGMAAIHAIYIAARKTRMDAPTAQFAFPYGDTLKLQEKFNPHQALFYQRGDADDLAQLEKDLARQTISGLFCEFPSNPLLTCVDLPRLRELADQFRFPIIIDETLGACINQNTLPVSDVTAISLTKFFSGTSDVMGGALILNEDAPFYQTFRNELRAIHEPEAFYGTDVIQLEKDSRDYRPRVEKINQTARTVSEYLRQHPAVDSVYYPALTDKSRYDQFRRPDGGYGGLLSFVLNDPRKHTEKVYDRLEITKGPNLGTSFSLCCPFVLIAHYNELEWAEKAGASRWLIRISVGTEEADELIARLERALPPANP